VLGAHNGDPRVFTGASIDISPADIAGVWENLGEQTVVVFDLFHVIMRVKFGVGPRPPLYPKITPPGFILPRLAARVASRSEVHGRIDLMHIVVTAFPLEAASRPEVHDRIACRLYFTAGWRRESQRDVTISRRSLSSLYFTAGRLSFPLHLVKKSAKPKLTSK